MIDIIYLIFQPLCSTLSLLLSTVSYHFIVRKNLFFLIHMTGIPLLPGKNSNSDQSETGENARESPS